MGNAPGIVIPVEFPITVGFEGGYALERAGLSANGQRIVREVPLPLNTLEEMAREAIA